MNKKRHSERRGLGRKREIRILQHNMQRSKTIPYEIRTQMDADGDDIILIQEPYSVDGEIPGFGTGVAIACRGSKYDPPMAAVGTKSKTLTPLEVAELCTTHCACMQIRDGETEVYAASLYFPPTENIVVGVQQLEKVLSVSEARGSSPAWMRTQNHRSFRKDAITRKRPTGRYFRELSRRE